MDFFCQLIWTKHEVKKLNSKQWLLLILILFHFCITKSQNQARHWYFGNSAGAVFSNGSPTVVAGGAITTSLGCSAISDAAGNLLFYTDGMTVYNASHTVMANGSGLLGVNAFQSSIILKKPQSNSLYYIFTVGGLSTNYGLHYSVVDMSLASGQGSVTSKNTLVYADSRDRISAGKHCNGNDIWVLSTGGTSASFVSCLLTASGISSVVSTPTTSNISPILGTGQMKLSPNGRKLGLTGFYPPLSGNCGLDIRILDFDNATGMVLSAGTNTVLYGVYNSTYPACGFKLYGSEFSPNSRYFYFSINQTVQKLDLCSTGSIVVNNVYNTESTTALDTANKRSFQLAPDGKIYVAQNNKTQVGVIINPNNTGSLASYTSAGIGLNTYTCQWGLPNFPGFYFEQKPTPNFTYTVNNTSCLTATFSTAPVCSSTGYSLSAYQWNFGDPGSGTANVSNISSPTHAYPSSGSYTVTLIRYFDCTGTDTLRQVIQISQPTLSVLNSTFQCAQTTVTAQISGGSGPYTYNWSASTSTIASSSFSSSGNYTVVVIDQGSGNCMRSLVFPVTVINLSATTVVSPTLICFGASNATATAAVSGGSGSYQYNWSALTGSTNIVSGLSAGNYTLQVLDLVKQCTVTQSFTVHQAQAISMQLTLSSATACANESLLANASATGGVPAYSFVWLPSNVSTSSLSISHPPGTYVHTLVLQDAMFCSAQQTFNLVFYPLPVLSLSSTSVCAGTTTTLTAAGALNYTWQPGNVSNNSVTPSLSITTLYTVTASDSNGCLNMATTQVLVYPLPMVTASNNGPLCTGQTLQLFTGNFVSYYWQGPNGFVSSLQQPFLNAAQLSFAGFYTLSVTDANGCKDSIQTKVVMLPSPLVTITGPSTVCAGQSISLQASGANSYTWSTGAVGANINFMPASSSSFTVTGTSITNTCTGTNSFSIQVLDCNLLGIASENNQSAPAWEVFPNPCTNKIIVSGFSPGDEIKFQLLDLNGKTCMLGQLHKTDSEITLSSNVEKGMYLLLLSNGTISISKKILVQ